MHSVVPLLDASGRRCSPTAVPGFRAGKPLRNKGRWYPADPSSVDETVAVCAKPAVLLGNRLNSLIVVLWRGGRRISETLSLSER